MSTPTDKSQRPLVSCIMTAYNVRLFLKDAISSVSRQTYPTSRIELIVVDDGSTDGSGLLAKKCLRSYQGPSRLVVQENGGAASALSAGIAAATGDYLAILDGDDEWKPEKVARAVEILESRPEVGLVYSDIDLIDESGAVLFPEQLVTDRKQQLLAWPHSSHEGPLPVGRVYGETIANNCTLSSTIVVRRSLAPAFAPLPSFVPFYDWWITTRVSAFSEIATTDTLTRYRRHSSNMTINLTGERQITQFVRDLEFRRKLLEIDFLDVASTAGLTRAISEIVRVGLVLGRTMESPFVRPFSSDDAGRDEAIELERQALDHPEHSHERVVLLAKSFARDPYRSGVIRLLMAEYKWFRAHPECRQTYTALQRYADGDVHVVVTAEEIVEDHALRGLLQQAVGPRPHTVVGLVGADPAVIERAGQAILSALPPGCEVAFEPVDAADVRAVAEIVGAGLVHLTDRDVGFPLDRLPRAGTTRPSDLWRALAIRGSASPADSPDPIPAAVAAPAAAGAAPVPAPAVRTAPDPHRRKTYRPGLSILLPAARRSSPEDAQTVWGDLRVALESVLAYAPGVDLVVGWNGLEEPRNLPDNPHMRLLRQAPGITTGSEAWNWCASQTDAEELLILGDDCVLHPDTLRLLTEDVETIGRMSAEPAGFVGCRSNYVKGPQNIRSSNGAPALSGINFPTESRVFGVDMIVPVAAWIRHETFDAVGGFPATNWFADDVCSWDLSNMGFRHFISRAYVHHVGERGTGQGKSSEILLEEGLTWLRDHRPDFLERKLGIAPPALAGAGSSRS